MADGEIAGGRDKDGNRERWLLGGSSCPKEWAGMLAPGRGAGSPSLLPPIAGQTQCGLQGPV